VIAMKIIHCPRCKDGRLIRNKHGWVCALCGAEYDSIPE